MDREDVLAALGAVNEVLKRKGKSETVLITGGAALMFLFKNFYRPIKDLDGCNISPELASAIEEVTWDLDLPEGWFNNDADQYYPPTETVDGPQFSNLHIQFPTKLYLLCRKIMAGRPAEKANDAKDVQFMLSQMPEIRTDRDWQAPYEKWFGKHDWSPFVAEAAHQVLGKTAGSGTEGRSSAPPEPLLVALVNQNQWKAKQRNPDGRVHIFTDPPEEEEVPFSPFRTKQAASEKIQRAAEFAAKAHESQKRKYTGDPYFTHLEAVASLVAAAGCSEDAICAAYLHDTIEDQNVTAEQIREEFGPRVAQLVQEVTQVSRLEDGNRKLRKEKDRQHYSSASPEGQTIKLADILHNGSDIIVTNPAFARTYIPECEALFLSLTKGDQALRDRVAEMIGSAKNKLDQQARSI